MKNQQTVDMVTNLLGTYLDQRAEERKLYASQKTTTPKYRKYYNETTGNMELGLDSDILENQLPLEKPDTEEESVNYTDEAMNLMSVYTKQAPEGSALQENLINNFSQIISQYTKDGSFVISNEETFKNIKPAIKDIYSKTTGNYDKKEVEKRNVSKTSINKNYNIYKGSDTYTSFGIGGETEFTINKASKDFTKENQRTYFEQNKRYLKAEKELYSSPSEIWEVLNAKTGKEKDGELSSQEKEKYLKSLNLKINRTTDGRFVLSSMPDKNNNQEHYFYLDSNYMKTNFPDKIK
tara:strand:- start:214 stop:1095 length:882 start_codon:yes stop_codon:yes gene_type:complete